MKDIAELLDKAQKAALGNTDEADAETVLAAVWWCAAHWQNEVRLLGNVRSIDIQRAIEEILLEKS